MAFKLFKPDYAFNDIYAITPEVLKEMGVKGIVFDIDQTIAPYEVELPTKNMMDYFALLKEANIKMAFVSNNKGPRVMKFNEGIGLFYVCKAGKPSPKGVKVCMDYFELKPEELISIGDQIFTDCISAHRAGIRFAMVKPINKQESLFFRIKRFLERPFVKDLYWMGDDAMKKLTSEK
jgi:HAD superfamily phosphatase (TIGR01668 family)